MSSVTLDKVSKELGGFYVPTFEVSIKGVMLDDDVSKDVIEVKYKDNIDELDSFQLTLNNWDDGTRRFKYIGSETEESLDKQDEAGTRYKLFEPCGTGKEVAISMGYVGQVELMISGMFTTMEPEFPSDGAATLNVRGLNLLHQLRRKKYDDSFSDMKDSEIAKLIATRKDKKLKAPRFPFEVRVSDAAMKKEPKIKFVAQKKQYDIDFLWGRARTRGHVIKVEEVKSGKPRSLYFGPSNETDERPTYELKWGTSLIQFSPRLTTANQYKSVTVNGFDRKTQRRISEKVDLDDRELKKMNPDLHRLIKDCDPREEYVVNEPVFTKEQAKDRARSLLLEQNKQMVKASGLTVGLPELKAGSKVVISGIGSRLGGTYFVTQTEHTINDSGYLTRFEARREEPSTSGGK